MDMELKSLLSKYKKCSIYELDKKIKLYRLIHNHVNNKKEESLHTELCNDIKNMMNKTDTLPCRNDDINLKITNRIFEDISVQMKKE